MERIEEKFENGLVGSFDWLSFTLFPEAVNEASLFSEHGLNKDDFTKMPYARYGYKYEYKMNGYDIRIMYGEANENCAPMGVHFVDISGSSIGAFLQAFKSLYDLETYSDVACMRFLFERILKNGQITRLDVAIDDIGCNFYTFDDVYMHVKEKRLSTKFRKYKYITEGDFSDTSGNTIYFGKRKNLVCLRVYDKKLEQENKNNGFNEGFTSDWLRWEFEFKDKKAIKFAQEFVNGTQFGILIMGVLSHYLRFIHLDNDNVSRCTTEETWTEFTNGIRGIKLSVPIRDKTLEEKKAWFKSQCAPTLAAIIMGDLGSIDFVSECLQYGSSRMNKHLKELVQLEISKFEVQQ